MPRVRVHSKTTLRSMRPMNSRAAAGAAGLRARLAEHTGQRAEVTPRHLRPEEDAVGEARRPLGQRINSYIAGGGDGKAGATNKRVCREQQQLAAKGDSLYLEYLVELDRFDFTVKYQRRAAEGLLIAFYEPYCPSERA